MSLDLSNDQPATEAETPAPEGARPDPKAAAATTPDPAAAATSKDTPAADSTPATEPEDKRARRAAESERDQLKREYEELKAQVERLKPYGELEDIGRKDPARWIAEMAEASGLSAERVLEMVVKRGAGEPAKLTAEERVEKLERMLAERDARDEQARKERETRDAETRGAEQRKANVAVTADFLKANAKDFPGLDDQDAEAVYQVVESRWASLGDRAPRDQEGLRALYRDAAKRVEDAARAELERRHGRFGYSKPTSVQAPAPREPFRGLSLDKTTAPAPPTDPDRVNTLEDIEAIAARMFS